MTSSSSNNRTFVDSKGNTWEWDETPETKQAIQQLHKTIQRLELECPDYGVGK
ncbi:hypothetical protein T040910_063 [Synechococcus phage S-CAM3]|uniref:Uncharacterized protein n=1 Tax=Synechococcus phage S-CAM3 TaxID=1883366 RepID=A0A1D8KIU3_9CAUD|nr:hypothetical protein BOW87_gp195 [Synechococcus phage S-CAM3]AOV58568.1 hypothetical protein S250808_063 [Synechococcus phage S-CAM3]AOV58807.1 hypothetical protein T040910_063 [Synechococcus phage S-CAM3]AOV59046.1 hypothetical protein C421010_063 [Synechococcus phage S-CAM3]